MRLIDADALRAYWLANGENKHVYDTNVVLDSIDEQPTKDAEPVVHGRWVDIPNKYWFTTGENPGSGNANSCSACGDINPNHFKTNFCPCCGAKMDEEAENV